MGGNEIGYAKEVISMGGRGASSGFSSKGVPYGSEYHKVYSVSNIKYIVYNGNETKTPMETMTGGRIYAVVDKDNEVRHIVMFDKRNKRYKQIDIKGKAHEIDGVWEIPHTHMGYEHDEHGTRSPTKREQKTIDRVLTMWYNYNAAK